MTGRRKTPRRLPCPASLPAGRRCLLPRFRSRWRSSPPDRRPCTGVHRFSYLAFLSFMTGPPLSPGATRDWQETALFNPFTASPSMPRPPVTGSRGTRFSERSCHFDGFSCMMTVIYRHFRVFTPFFPSRAGGRSQARFPAQANAVRPRRSARHPDRFAHPSPFRAHPECDGVASPRNAWRPMRGLRRWCPRPRG